MVVEVTSPADRLLATAGRLFAAEGIRAVGIERLVTESAVARASLYQAFGSKDQLAAEYLRHQHETDRRAWHVASRRIAEPIGKVLLFFECAARAARQRHYPGCLYINAAAEFPDRSHPVWLPIDEHREWMRAAVAALLREAGVPQPDELAASIQLLYDGGLSGSKATGSVDPIMRAQRLARTLIDREPADATE
ncbi:TetR/AcrR family transcriptional regulator [Nocardia panacis]|uniref:TetR/AcrR family transcriptional regulator n=1 Tax=Nocardia panacis TaxID=2340916 RepID=A0A3A4K2J7_9NOCA|nr:TetR family transcriptional regulator [Nocardia panacis]RJO70654.1 TetR/AcrR family transcriptional regulator [Nocardia panacis]